jgi:hypothetical protein
VSKSTSTLLYLGAELRAAAEDEAPAEGISLSAWVRNAISRQLEQRAIVADGLAAMREWEAEEGPIPAEVRAETRRELEEAGILPARRTA